MKYSELVEQAAGQAAALRVAAVAAGPDAAVPTCPGWTVRRLITHLAGLHDFAHVALRTDPAAPQPIPPAAPEVDGFVDALGWWDTTFARLVADLRELGPGVPAWTTTPNPSTDCWARRQAHELAIHRLDAELAAGTGDAVRFDPRFAANGIEEFTEWAMFGTRSAYDGDRHGTVRLHAEDLDRTWLVAIEPGKPFTATEEPGPTADASIAGPAEAVYRALWKRPNDATISGDQTLLDLIGGP